MDASLQREIEKEEWRVSAQREGNRFVEREGEEGVREREI